MPYTKPIPDGAEIIARKGKPHASFLDGDGKPVVAPLTNKGTGELLPSVEGRCRDLNEWAEDPVTPVAPYIPFRNLVNLASQVYEETGFDLFTAIRIGRIPEDWSEWGPRMLAREEELQELADDCLCAAGQTGYSVEEVERRVKALVDPVRAIIRWRCDESALSPNRYNAGTWHEPIENYLHAHYKRAQDAREGVHALAVRAERTPRNPSLSVLDDMARRFEEIEREVTRRGGPAPESIPTAPSAQAEDLSAYRPASEFRW
jgi:hypothetical protein